MILHVAMATLMWPLKQNELQYYDFRSGFAKWASSRAFTPHMLVAVLEMQIMCAALTGITKVRAFETADALLPSINVKTLAVSGVSYMWQ